MQNRVLLSCGLVVALCACASAPQHRERASRTASWAPPKVASSSVAVPPAGAMGEELRRLILLCGERGVAQLSRPGALAGNPQWHVPLPPMISRASRHLEGTGYSQDLLRFELSINRAAELAMADFASQLSVVTTHLPWPAHARISGGDRAGTAYLRVQRGAELWARLRPLVDQALAQTESTGQYNALVLSAGPLGAFLAGPRDDLGGYVATQALNNLFEVMSAQEISLRRQARGSLAPGAQAGYTPASY